MTSPSVRKRIGCSLPVLVMIPLCWALSVDPANAAYLTVPSFSALNNGDNNATVQTYLQGKVNTWHPGGTITVTGAVVDTTYNGDGHVVGPKSGTTYVSDTLFSKDWDNGAFLANASGYDRITMKFSFKIYDISFDYEIFPDGTTPDGTKITDPSKDSSWPDFTLREDFSNGTSNDLLTTLAVMPGTSGLSYTHSPSSGNNTELAPQFIGKSGRFTLAGGANEVEFIDWPATIGISNLVVNDAPEPSSLALFGCGVVGLLGWVLWKGRRTQLVTSTPS